MFRSLIIIFALLFMYTGLPGYSQDKAKDKEVGNKSESVKSSDPEENAQEITLEEVLENYYKATGGIENWRDIKTMRMGGEMISMGQPIPVRATFMRPNKCRVEYKVKNAVIVQAYDGERGWQHNPNGEIIIPQPMSEKQSKYLHDTCDLEGPLNDYKEKGHSIELVGKETLYGQDTYKLIVKYKSGNVQTYYIDTDTFLPVRVDGVYLLDAGEHNVTTSFFDYKKTGKIIVPHKIDFDITGSPGTEQMNFKTVEINPSVRNSYFRKPD